MFVIALSLFLCTASVPYGAATGDVHLPFYDTIYAPIVRLIGLFFEFTFPTGLVALQAAHSQVKQSLSAREARAVQFREEVL